MITKNRFESKNIYISSICVNTLEEINDINMHTSSLTWGAFGKFSNKIQYSNNRRILKNIQAMYHMGHDKNNKGGC